MALERAPLWARKILARGLIVALRGAFAYLALRVGLRASLSRLGRRFDIRIDPVAPPGPDAPARLIAGFAAPNFGARRDKPDRIDNSSPPFERTLGFATGAAETFARLLARNSDFQIWIARLPEAQSWRRAKATLAEEASEISDRLPEMDARLRLRLDLPPRAFDDLAAKIQALEQRRGEAAVWLAVGFDSPTFEIPKTRKMIAGRVQPDSFRRELDATKLQFELGLVEGFLTDAPARYTSALAWTTTEIHR